MVGGRCAGAAVALRFARRGYSVLLVDRVKPDRETLSTHLLLSSTVTRLASLGLLDRVNALGAPQIGTFVVEYGSEIHQIPVKGRHNYALSIRRSLLDPLVIDAAKAAGVVVRCGITARDVLRENDRVCGVRLSAGNEEWNETARIVIGADGRHSMIARQAGAREYNGVESDTGILYAYYQDVLPHPLGPDTVQFASGAGCDIVCAPCDSQLHVILLVISGEEFNRTVRERNQILEDRLRSSPSLAPRLAVATRAGAIYPASPAELRGFYRIPFGPGWALVGDAAYHAHPAAANGIADVLRSAELVERFVHQAWSENLPGEAYLDRYQAIRDQETAALYHYSYELGRINPFENKPVRDVFLGMSSPDLSPSPSRGRSEQSKHQKVA